MNTLIVIGIAAGAVVILVLGILLAIRSFYKVPKADEALVKTGGKEPVVTTGGGIWVIPMFHKVAPVSLQAIKIPIVRTGADAVPSSDMIPVEIKGEMFVQINPQDEKAIVLAVQSLGTANPAEMANVVRGKIDSQVTDALRTAAFQRTFIDLNREKKQFAEAVIALLQDDLSKLGLTLTAVSVTHITQGPFTEDTGDVIAAVGRRNVAETVQENRQRTNLITRQAEIAVQEQDVEAREKALTLDLRQKQREADQSRQVAEYQATQKTETAKVVLLQQQAEAEAKAAQERAVAEAAAREAEKTSKAQIAQAEAVAIRQTEAEAKKKSATEQAAITIAQAEAARKVAEEEAARQKSEAEIARQKAVEAAEIEKDKAIKVAGEQRQQAISEAEVAREQALALRRADEAAARATQAEAEAKQRAAEEQVVTVKAEAEADRQKRIVVIKAEEAAAKDKLEADKDAYIAAKKAEGERDAAQKRAEATRAAAEGQAQAVKLEAEGKADALKAAAEGYKFDKTTRAEADFTASEKEAAAKIRLADATLAQGKAEAEAHRLKIEAGNAVAKELLIRDVAVKALDVAPAVVHELMAPVAQVAHDVRVLQVNGLGGNGDGQSVPGTILGTGLALSGALPLVRELVQGVFNNDDVKAIASELGGAATQAIREVATAARGRSNGEVAPSQPSETP